MGKQRQKDAKRERRRYEADRGRVSARAVIEPVDEGSLTRSGGPLLALPNEHVLREAVANVMAARGSVGMVKVWRKAAPASLRERLAIERETVVKQVGERLGRGGYDFPSPSRRKAGELFDVAAV
jgi:hypothetical protein